MQFLLYLYTILYKLWKIINSQIAYQNIVNFKFKIKLMSLSRSTYFFGFIEFTNNNESFILIKILNGVPSPIHV